MSLPIHLDPLFAISAASRYKWNLTRVFIEYIDNSLDSAEKVYFDKSRNQYTKDIKIDVFIDRRNHTVTVRDNCWWIEDIERVVEKIWNSNRRGDDSQNGQFWFWMQSFLSLWLKSCLYVTSKVAWKQAYKIKVPAIEFTKWDEAKVDDPEKTIYCYESWTEVTIWNISREDLKEFDTKVFVEKIAIHFEKVLERWNLSLIVHEWDNAWKCLPFNYDNVVGEVYEKVLEFPQISWNPKIKIYLKTTEDEQLKRPPFFIIKWRRINDVLKVKAYMNKSEYKRKIRENPSLIWYIDLWNSVEPVLDRTDIQDWAISRTIFNKIIKEETEISSFLEKVNRKSSDKHYNNLSDYLEKALAKLARLEHMNYRENGNDWENDSWDLSGFVWPVWLQWWSEWFWQQDGNEWHVSPDWDERSIWQWDWDWVWPDWSEWTTFPDNNTTGDDSDNTWDSWEPRWDILWQVKPRKSTWFAIHFVDWTPPIDSTTRKGVRSELVGWEIRIYKEHEDFVARLSKSQSWQDQISERLITYLAWEITVHYKHVQVTKKQEQPLYNKDMFSNLVDFIYNFEDLLKDLKWKNLSDL